MRILSCFLLAVLLMAPTLAVAGAAQSPFFELRAIGSPASAGLPLVARALYRFCVYEEMIGSSQVSQSDGVVTLTVTMVPFPPGTACFTPPPPDFYDFPLGSFAEGDYTLILETISSIPGRTYLPVSTSFSVGPALRSVPALSPASWLVLASAMVLVLARSRRRLGQSGAD
jgi:hypothetical protein